jgi:radical SAM superfamily enzyme YgiQ (UPF0313 family)
MKMKKRIVMIYPEIPTTYWSYKYILRFLGKKASIPPLGLITVASMLPDDYEVKVIDMNISRLSLNDIEEADFAFISAMIVQKRSFAEVVSLCNKVGTPVVAGGPYPISSYDKIEGVDHFVLDEAEVTLPKFLGDLEEGCPKSIYRDKRKPDITKTPPPRFDLIDVEAYISIPLQYSRGCPFNCEFCDIIEMFGRTPRTKLPEQFVNEMESIYKIGFRGPLFIVDDNFIGNKQKVKTLLRRLIEWQRDHGYPFSLSTEASINLAQDDELLDLMVKAGFTMVFVGIETPDEKTLTLIQKKQNLRTSLSKSIMKIQQQGIEVTGGFIVGFDTDPDDIFDRQINFIQKAGIPVAMVGLLNVLPNTQLFRRLEKEGRTVDESSGNNTHDLRLNFVPRMPQEVLLDGYKRVISELYTPGRYFERCFTLMKRMPVGIKQYKSISKSDIKTFLLSFVRQTFSFYGVHYLRFLIRALQYNASLFPVAVALAVQGHHFITITKEILKAEEFSTKLNQAMKPFQSRVMKVIEKRQKQVAAEMETHIIKLKNNFQSKYWRLNRGVQKCLENTFAEFESHCEEMISKLRLVYL